MARLKKHLFYIALILFGILAIYFRYISLQFVNSDLEGYEAWYTILVEQGISNALASNFSIYTPPYTYLLALATLTRSFLSPLISIKLIPIAFDFLSAIFIYRIVKLKFSRGIMPHFAAVTFLIAPTVILNSSFWGQIDSIYTSFLLICLYYLLVERPLLSMLAFGTAFAIKAQAVFLLPFLFLMAIRKRIPRSYFGLIPLVYLIAILPVVLLGRPLNETLFIYLNQAGEFNQLSRAAPNLYTFVPESWYHPAVVVGILMTVILLFYWIRFSAQADPSFTTKSMILAALVSVALTPFLLPKMHDRYFYPADVLSLLLAFHWPALWFLPLLYQIISTLAYSNFLFETNSSAIVTAALLNTITIAIILRIQTQAEKPIETNPKVSSILSWAVTVLVPIALAGLGMRLLLTPIFLKIEHNLPNFPPDEHGFTTQDRLQWAPYTLNYLLNNKDIKYLGRLRFDNGLQVFNDRERLHMEDVKVLTRNILGIWFFSLLALFVLSLLAWFGNWLPEFRHGMRRGGCLCIGLVLSMGLFAVLSFRQFFALFNNLFFEGDSWLFTSPDTLVRLFPVRFWQDAFLVIAIITLGGGLALGLGLKPKSKHEFS